MPNESIKPQLIDLLKSARADEVAFVGSLTDAERNVNGALDHWSAKDLVAHMAFWRAIMVKRLLAAQRGETPPDFDNYLALNDQTFEASRYRTWAEVLTDSERAFDDLVAKVKEMSDDELTDPTRYEWREGEPLWTSVRGNGYDHPEAHIAQFYFDRGERARALEMLRTVTETTIRLDPSPQTRGTAIYNLGCFLALNGESAQAIDLVRESFGLRHDLVEFYKQDSDLNSLRDLSDFKALYPAA
jgi:tetratricopeptide (TPR) repeat protein